MLITPASPPPATRRLVDNSSIEHPAVLVQTADSGPNVALSGSSYPDQRMGELLGALGTLSLELAKALLPRYKGHIQGICLTFDAISKVKEIIDEGRIDAFDAIELGSLGLDFTALTREFSGHPISADLDMTRNTAGLIVKMHDQYYAGAVTDPLLEALSHAPQPSVWKAFYRVWDLLSDEHFHQQLAESKRPGSTQVNLTEWVKAR